MKCIICTLLNLFTTAVVSGFDYALKRLKTGVVPRYFPWSTSETPEKRERADRSEQREKKRRRLQDESASRNAIVDKPASTAEPQMFDIFDADIDVQECVIPSEGGTFDSSTQTHLTSTVNMDDAECQTQPGASATMTHTDFIQDSDGLNYYTGIQQYDTFMNVLHSLGPAAYQLNYWNGVSPRISVVDQFLMTLVKLRLYRPNFELSRMFGMSEPDVYGIIVTWIRFMSLQWREINLWPERELVTFFSPRDFRAKFPKTRVILDGLEIPVKKPSNPAAQQITFSKYKNRNTGKSVVGVTPGGLTSYISPAYGGSASDRHIIERSPLTSLMDTGDEMMVDKGFDVQDIFAPLNVTVNIPTFFRKKNRLPSKSVLRDRRISSKRVHVERIIGMAKTFKILTQPLVTTEAMLASDILFICFMLVNFRKGIVPENA